MANNSHALPPSKRFTLVQQKGEESFNLPSSQTTNNPLPAKKRFECQNQHSHLPATSCCLPAKKRVWAPHPLSLEDGFLDEEPKWKKGKEDLKLVEEEDEEKPIQEDGKEEEEDEEDDGVICAVCRSTDGDPSDPIVFCDGCDLMVHASCYGNPLIKSIPQGDWFCSTCQRRDEEQSLYCCLCPVQGGAMKPTTGGGWAHIMCALLVPEVFFQDPVGRDGVDLSRVPIRRWEGDCCLCGSGIGCVVECSEPKCELAFHVSCGVEAELCVEYREGKGGGIVVGFCREHTKLWKKQQLTGKFKIVARQQDDAKRNK